MPSSKIVNDLAYYADSDSSCHVSGDARHIEHMAKYNGKQSLTVGNGEKLYIAHIEDSLVHTHNKRTMFSKDILHVLEIKKNVLSVSHLTACNNIIVEFDSCGCVVKEKGMGVALF